MCRRCGPRATCRPAAGWRQRRPGRRDELCLNDTAVPQGGTQRRRAAGDPPHCNGRSRPGHTHLQRPSGRHGTPGRSNCRAPGPPHPDKPARALHYSQWEPLADRSRQRHRDGRCRCSDDTCSCCGNARQGCLPRGRHHPQRDTPCLGLTYRGRLQALRPGGTCRPERLPRSPGV